jgi:hypothetical protein
MRITTHNLFDPLLRGRGLGRAGERSKITPA